MPRTRIITDREVFEAAIHLIGEDGVSSLTFASLSKRTGLAPPTLVQRFKTKKGLLSDTTSYCLQKMESSLKEVVKQNTSPLTSLMQAMVLMAGTTTSVEAFANGQVFLQLGLTDPSLNEKLRSTMNSVRADIEALLKEAIAIKELRTCDTHALAHALQAMYEGSIVTWAAYQQEPIEKWVGALLQSVIEPYVIIKER